MSSCSSGSCCGLLEACKVSLTILCSQEVVIMKDRSTGKSRGFGFVTFFRAADAACAANQEHVVDGRRCEVNPYAKRTPRMHKDATLGGSVSWALPGSLGEISQYTAAILFLVADLFLLLCRPSMPCLEGAAQRPGLRGSLLPGSPCRSAMHNSASTLSSLALCRSACAQAPK